VFILPNIVQIVSKNKNRWSYFSFVNLLSDLTKSRRSPDDDKELDVLEGYKYFSMVLC
jgi:hypothetical protein